MGIEFNEEFTSLVIPKRFKDAIEIYTTKILELYPDARVFLFGSCAKRWVSEDSDVDLFVLIDRDINVREERLKLRKYIDDSYLDTDIECDVLVYNRQEFKKYYTQRNTFAFQIGKDCIRVV